jgi:hypothetical protein
MRNTVVRVVVVAALLAGPASAQLSQTEMAFEIRPAAGIFVPTGGMRDDLAAAALLGFQTGFEVNSNMHLMLGGFWSQTKARFPSFSVKGTDVWQFDAGVEGNLITPMGRGWLFRPFAGVGGGMRVYDYEAPNIGSRTCAMGYGSLGLEFQRNVGALRVEGRDNVSCFKSPVSGSYKTRNDLGFTLGFVYHVM